VNRQKLVCLLPARNCQSDLPEYLASAERFADAIVALDDGSGDRTRELLETHPLVKVVLANPPRSTYTGWDDGANRNRLLEAAAGLEPDWILSLDADERLDADDALALREFLEGDALPGFAYGFRVFRMLEDLEYHGPSSLWAFRLFAFEPGHVFPRRRLHAPPVPTSIPPERWLRTTLRIQHVGGLTAERRLARLEKYREADPENAFQSSYRNVLVSGPAVRWERRDPGLAVLLTDVGEAVLAELELDGPLLSAIIISRDDEARIESVVRAVVEQECPEPFEVIVVTSGSDRTAAIVRERFPQVRLVELPRPALPGEARNAGLRVARGDYISFPGSHVELPKGSLAARMRAHLLGHQLVTGTVLNGTFTRAGWASYLLDHSLRLPGRPSGLLAGPPATCSYARELLLDLGGFPDDMRSGEDTVVNHELTRRGYRAYRAPDVTYIHNSPCGTVPRLIRQHFVRGRGMGRILVDDHRERGGALDGLARPVLLRRYIRRRLRTTTQNVKRWGPQLLPTYRRVYPLILLAAAASWIGARYEILRSEVGKPRLLREAHAIFASSGATRRTTARGPAR
jgi:glycosyltransferase involved in cell wall biosynthesis